MGATLNLHFNTGFPKVKQLAHDKTGTKCKSHGSPSEASTMVPE